jgi:hypothetical protein
LSIPEETRSKNGNVNQKYSNVITAVSNGSTN